MGYLANFYPGVFCMEEIKDTKSELRKAIQTKLKELTDQERAEKIEAIENRLFEFANFLEAKIVLLYLNNTSGVDTRNILKRAYQYNKIVVLPIFGQERPGIKLYKVDDMKADIKSGPGGVVIPDPERCKRVPIDRVDIAIIPSVALDEKGGRVGSGRGNYDRLIPKLAITTRKVSLALEDQIVPQVPMESHDKHVDIIITEKRTIYKI